MILTPFVRHSDKFSNLCVELVASLVEFKSVLLEA
jgi:hypothetical protein